MLKRDTHQEEEMESSCGGGGSNPLHHGCLRDPIIDVHRDAARMHPAPIYPDPHLSSLFTPADTWLAQHPLHSRERFAIYTCSSLNPDTSSIAQSTNQTFWIMVHASTLKPLLSFTAITNAISQNRGIGLASSLLLSPCQHGIGQDFSNGCEAAVQRRNNVNPVATPELRRWPSAAERKHP